MALTIKAASATINNGNGKTKAPTIDILAYSGGPMLVSGYGRVVVDLAGMEIPTSVPLLADHENKVGAIVGQGKPIKKNGQLFVEGELATATDAGKQIIELAKAGFEFGASIGCEILQARRIQPGEKVTVNNQTITAPAGGFFLIEKSQLREVSLCAIACDNQTSVAIAASQSFKQGTRKMNDSQTTDFTELRVSEAALFQEQARIDEIKADCRKHPSIAKEAISEGWDIRQTRLAVVRASRASVPAIYGHDTPTDGKTLEAALCISAGLNRDRIHKWYGDRTMEAAESRDLRGAGIHTLVHETITASGGNVRPGRVVNSTIESAFQAERQLQAGVGFSTVTLTGILGNVAQKALISSFEAQEVVWSKICAIRSHQDFKTNTRVRLDSNGAFKQIAPDGELQNLGLADASYTNKLETYGARITLNRQQIINDDLHSFLQLPSMLGRMAALRLEEAVFVLLLSNPSSFFHANNKNLISGGSSALSIDSLTTAEQKFRDQVDSNAKPILVSPKILLVPTGLRILADNIMAEKLLIDGSSVKQPARNAFAGRFEVASSPYINNTGILTQDGAAITGQTATQWYLFAEPNVRAAMGVAFLNGQQLPTIESSDVDFASLGMSWRGYWDFGVGMEEPQAAVKNAGA